MKPGFQTQTINVQTGDGLNDVLLEPLVFCTDTGIIYRAPIGGTTDGLSVPRCVQNIIPPTGGSWMSGVLHDSAYRDQLERWDVINQVWVLAHLNQAMADELILEAMTSQGVAQFERDVIYRALRLFGSAAFIADRKVT